VAYFRWPRESGEILYVNAVSDEMVSVPIRTQPTLEVGKPTTLFRMNQSGREDWNNFDVSDDGKRIYAIVFEAYGGEIPFSLMTGISPR
jgi:hypothetical protein